MLGIVVTVFYVDKKDNRFPENLSCHENNIMARGSGFVCSVYVASPGNERPLYRGDGYLRNRDCAG